MNSLYYQKKINDVIMKCPIEAGIEILVYNLLDECIDMDEYALVDINRIWKNQDSRLVTDAGISDIAILSTDFVFKNENTGSAYGFVEVKAAGISLIDTVQASGQMEKVSHFIYTNGIVWKYYFNRKLKWERNITTVNLPYSIRKIKIDNKQFQQLKEDIKSIKWNDDKI